jgi:hypothetical protein
LRWIDLPFPIGRCLKLSSDKCINFSRFLPANISFQIADISKEVDFGGEKFDIVHTRFVLFHVGLSPIFRVSLSV